MIPKSRYPFSETFPPAVKVLLIANIGSYILGMLWVRYDLIFGLMAPEVFTQLRLYQFVTYFFIHSSSHPLHIIVNMLILWMFGRELEAYWGTIYFLKYYFVTGIGAGLCSLPFIWGDSSVVIGASGAIFGLLLAYGMLFPNRMITLLLLFVLPVRLKARQLVFILTGLELLLLFNRGGGGGIAHFAHLGGALVGFIYLKWPTSRKKKESIPSGFTPPDPGERFQDELNRVLDKLAREGWGGLTNREKEFLHDAKHHL